MISNRMKPGAAFWATVVAVVVLVIYPLSLGPLTWLDYHGFMPEWSDGPLRTLYAPLVWLGKIGVEGPGMNALGRAINWYVDLWWK